MRNVVASLFVAGLFSLPVAADQGRSGGSPASPGIKACSLLTKDLAMKVSGGVNKAVFDIPPSEEPAGKSGSACDYADIHLQIDPFSVSFVDATAQKDKTWVPVPGVGDRAWFHNNRDRFAELIAGTSIPVYAIGGLTRADMEDAWRAGAHGVAMIRGAWS